MLTSLRSSSGKRSTKRQGGNSHPSFCHKGFDPLSCQPPERPRHPGGPPARCGARDPRPSPARNLVPGTPQFDSCPTYHPLDLFNLDQQDLNVNKYSQTTKNVQRTNWDTSGHIFFGRGLTESRLVGVLRRSDQQGTLAVDSFSSSSSQVILYPHARPPCPPSHPDPNSGPGSPPSDSRLSLPSSATTHSVLHSSNVMLSCTASVMPRSGRPHAPHGPCRGGEGWKSGRYLVPLTRFSIS